MSFPVCVCVCVCVCALVFCIKSCSRKHPHVFIPLDNYDSKLRFKEKSVLFMRGGVLGKQLDLARQYPKMFVSVPFAESSEESWRSGIMAAIEKATGQRVANGPTWLEQALQKAHDAELTLALDEVVKQAQVVAQPLLRSRESFFGFPPSLELVMISSQLEAGCRECCLFHEILRGSQIDLHASNGLGQG